MGTKLSCTSLWGPKSRFPVHTFLPDLFHILINGHERVHHLHSLCCKDHGGGTRGVDDDDDDPAHHIQQLTPSRTTDGLVGLPNNHPHLCC